VLRWTSGKAFVATGSPFSPVDIGGEKISIAQCNNSYIFPGLGLGVIASKASEVTDNMMMAASRALAETSPLASQGEGELLPRLSNIREISKVIAEAVFKQAIQDGVAVAIPEDLIMKKIQSQRWEPEYREYRRTSF
jgi:malate dehydrogenase (oxaloacetate-decarboxylating)